MSKNIILQMKRFGWIVAIVVVLILNYFFNNSNIVMDELNITYIENPAKGKKNYERYYQTLMCNQLGGIIEKRLIDKTRVDCLTDIYAIEVDFAKKWAESIGQSLYYAKMTDRKPAIGLIVDEREELRYLQRVKLMAKEYNIKIFQLEK